MPTPWIKDSLSAVRYALLTLSVLPVLAVFAALLFSFWPWAPAAQHLLLLGLLGSILADVSLRSFRKIPFACSYLPGKSKVRMVFWFGIIPLVIAIHQAARLKLHLMSTPLTYWAMATTMATAAIAARFATDRTAQTSEQELYFEETASDELVCLGLRE